MRSLIFYAFAIIFLSFVSFSSASASSCDDRKALADRMKETATKIGALSVDQLNLAHKQSDLQKIKTETATDKNSAVTDELNKNSAEISDIMTSICHLVKGQDDDLRAFIDIVDSDPGHCGLSDSKRDQLFTSLKSGVTVRVSCGDKWR